MFFYATLDLLTLLPQMSSVLLLLPKGSSSRLVLLELASDGAGGELHGVGVGEETSRVGLEGGNGETSSGVGTIVQNASGEWTGQAPERLSPRVGVEVLVLVCLGAGVGEGDSWRAGGSDGRLVDVRGGHCGRGVVAS